MNHGVTLSDEELEVIEPLVRQEVETTRVEVRRSDLPEYKDSVRRRLASLEALLAKLQQAKKAA